MNESENTNVIYTFLMGNYENLKKPLVITEGWDHVCFTDNPNLESDIWDIRLCLPEHASIKDNKRKAMMHKIEYFKFFGDSYKYIISIDSGATIQSDLNKFINEIDLGEHDMAILKHPQRNCAYEEAKVVMNDRLDYRPLVNTQVERYKKEKYPPNNGLWATGLIVRNNQSHDLREVCKIWSSEYENGSRRDQVSVNYSFWKAKQKGLSIKVKPLSYKYVSGNTFLFQGHVDTPGRQVK